MSYDDVPTFDPDLDSGAEARRRRARLRETPEARAERMLRTVVRLVTGLEGAIRSQSEAMARLESLVTDELRDQRRFCQDMAAAQEAARQTTSGEMQSPTTSRPVWTLPGSRGEALRHPLGWLAAALLGYATVQLPEALRILAELLEHWPTR